MKKISGRQIIAAVLCGLLLALASPGQNSLAPAVWLALVPLFYALCQRDTTMRSAAVIGLIAGITYYPLLLYWIVIVLEQYGGVPLWGAVPAMLLLALYMSLYLAAFSALVHRLQGKFPLIWSAPIAWVALDYLRSLLFTGFPWSDLAYSQFRTPLLIQISDLTGHHGVTFLIVMVNALVFQAFTGRKKSTTKRDLAFRTAIILVIFVLSYNLARIKNVAEELSENPTFGVGVVQGNISQGQKWLPQLQRETFQKYISLSSEIMASNNPALIVWPETAIPFYLAESTIKDEISRLAAAKEGLTVLTGAPYREKGSTGSPTRYFNSAFFINGKGLRPDHYSKQHLVMFGEYVPLKNFLPFLAPLVETVADFTPGKFQKPVTCQNVGVGVLICFESIFPTLARHQVENGAGLLVNLTNDAWYGRSSAPWQHLSMAVFRAVENRRSLARSANTGISGFIDPLGRMHELSPLFEDFSAYKELPLTSIKSVFTFYGGHRSGIICLVAALLLTALASRKEKSLL
ncbi:MAG: apolipoprotein N-acyltransferase [Thermodesulfobacteriota bacterium]